MHHKVLVPAFVLLRTFREIDMPLELREHKLDDDWNELIQCECESYSDPPNSAYILLRPKTGNSHEAREGFKELRDRVIAQQKHDPTSVWFKVVDTDIGDKIVGAAQWNVFTENPYPEPVEHPVDATWWPEGGHTDLGSSDCADAIYR